MVSLQHRITTLEHDNDVLVKCALKSAHEQAYDMELMSSLLKIDELLIDKIYGKDPQPTVQPTRI
jgi:hypothetical protein